MATAPLFTGLDSYKLTGVTVTDRELGHGSYATVLELEYLGLKCAGKKIHELLLRQGDTSYTVRRFEEECRLLSQIRHPNIVQFLGVHFQQGVRAPILVMEFLHTNLTACISNYGILRREISYSILHDVALGLCYLHSQTPRIIHRDLSSNNVLLTPNMTAKIADLGVARMLNLTPLQMTKTPGTPVFMPPEVKVDNPKYDTSVDIFSCGVMMIHIFSGKWPELQIEENEIEIKRIISVCETQQHGEDSHTEARVELITRCIRGDPTERARASEVLERISDLRKESSALFANQLEMLKRIELQEEEKRILKEEGEANIREAQHKKEKLSRENFVYNSQIKDLQLQLKESDTEIQTLRADREHTVAELEHKHTLDETRITTLMQEREESERQLTSKRKAIEEELAKMTEQFQLQVSRERETVNMLSIENKKLRSISTELTKKLNDLESEMSKMKSKITEKDNIISKKDVTIKSKCTILEAKNRAMKEKHAIISEMSQEISRAKQYVLDKQQVLLARLQWRQCADIPTKLGVGTTVLINGKVYCRPGVAADFTADDKDDRYIIYCYDPLQDQWTTLPPIPVRCFGLGQIDDRLIAVGGLKKGGDVMNNEVYTFNERSKEWKRKIPPMPTARCAPGVLSLHKYSALAVVGGFIAGRCEYLKVVEVFKQDTLQWYKSNPMPIAARFDSSLTVIENTCYILGGQYGVEKFHNKAHYIPADHLISNCVLASQTTTHSGGSNAQQSAWKKLPDTPTYGPAVATLDGNLIAIGGVTYSSLGLKTHKSSAMYMYTPSSKCWIYIGDLPSAMTAAANLSQLDILVFSENASVYKGTPLLFK